jgi:hypothetical protein
MSKTLKCKLDTYGALTRQLTSEEQHAQKELLSSLRKDFVKSGIFTQPKVLALVSNTANLITTQFIKNSYGCVPPEFEKLLSEKHHLLLKQSPPSITKNTAFTLLWLVSLFISWVLVAYVQQRIRAEIEAYEASRVLTTSGVVEQAGEIIAWVSRVPGPASFRKQWIDFGTEYVLGGVGAAAKGYIADNSIQTVTGSSVLSSIAKAIAKKVPFVAAAEKKIGKLPVQNKDDVKILTIASVSPEESNCFTDRKSAVGCFLKLIDTYPELKAKCACPNQVTDLQKAADALVLLKSANQIVGIVDDKGVQRKISPPISAPPAPPPLPTFTATKEMKGALERTKPLNTKEIQRIQDVVNIGGLMSDIKKGRQLKSIDNPEVKRAVKRSGLESAFDGAIAQAMKRRRVSVEEKPKDDDW